MLAQHIIAMAKSQKFKSGHKQLFQKFCEDNYLEKESKPKVTSKTVSEEKAGRIKQVIRGEKLEVHSPSFKFWVKKTKKFELLSYPELNLHDVLCLSVKVKVS